MMYHAGGKYFPGITPPLFFVSTDKKVMAPESFENHSFVLSNFASIFIDLFS